MRKLIIYGEYLFCSIKNCWHLFKLWQHDSSTYVITLFWRANIGFMGALGSLFCMPEYVG